MFSGHVWLRTACTNLLTFSYNSVSRSNESLSMLSVSSVGSAYAAQVGHLIVLDTGYSFRIRFHDAVPITGIVVNVNPIAKQFVAGVRTHTALYSLPQLLMLEWL